MGGALHTSSHGGVGVEGRTVPACPAARGQPGTLVLQSYLLMLQGLQPLLHLETVILSPSALLGMYLSKDDVLT
jgi:hypothetical protein